MSREISPRVKRAIVTLAICLVSLAGGLRVFGAQGATGPQRSQAKASTNSAKESASGTRFEPLERWKAAVVAGDKAAIAAFYSTAPAAVTITPQGRSSDPGAEPQYWEALKSAGLSSFDAYVLEIVEPRPGIRAFNMHVELNLPALGDSKRYSMSLIQYWADTGGGLRIIGTQRGDLVPLKAPLRLPKPASNPQLYPGPGEAQADLAAALSRAAREHKRVLVVFGGNWCYDCHVLDASFHSPQVAPLLKANYEVVHVNVGSYTYNLGLAKRFQIPLEKGVPSIAVLESNGNLLFSQKQGEFESVFRIGPEDVVSFLQKWKPPNAN